MGRVGRRGRCGQAQLVREEIGELPPDYDSLADIELADIELGSGLGRKVVRRALRLLGDAGVLETVPGSEGHAIGLRVPTDTQRTGAPVSSSIRSR